MIVIHLEIALLNRSPMLWGDPAYFQIATPGLRFLDGLAMVPILGWMAIILSFAAIVFQHSRWLLLATGLCSAPFLLSTSVGRYAFSYTPTIALIAIGIGELFRRKESLFVFVISVYAISAIQKLVSVRHLYPWVVFDFMSVPTSSYIENFPISLLALVKGMVILSIPGEILLCAALLAKKRRKFGFWLMFLFHSLIGIASGSSMGLLSVGCMIWIPMTMYSVFDSQIKIFEIWRISRIRWSLLGLAITFPVYYGGLRRIKGLFAS